MSFGKDLINDTFKEPSKELLEGTLEGTLRGTYYGLRNSLFIMDAVRLYWLHTG